MNSFLKQFFFSIVLVLFLFAVPYFLYTYAQDASVSATGCFILNQNNLPSNYPLPPECDSGSSGGLTNPFPDGWETGRLDMGYDGTFTTKIVAPFDGIITYVCSSGCGWGGGFLTIKANQKPAGLPQSTLYFAEGIVPTVHLNKKVTAGDTLATPGPNGFGCGVGCIEWGVEKDDDPDPTYDTYARYLNNSARGEYNTSLTGQCPHWSTAARDMVHNFFQWAQKNFRVPNPVPPISSPGDCAGSA